MKKIVLFGLATLLIVLLGGCGRKVQDMAKPDSEGNYTYKNESLGFSLVLPKEFIYYQVQRKNAPEFTDIEIFVPTSDISYPREVPGYAKPVVLRKYEGNWESNKDKDSNFLLLKEKSGNAYAIKFWDKVPSDWKEKWDYENKAPIIGSFTLL